MNRFHIINAGEAVDHALEAAALLRSSTGEQQALWNASKIMEEVRVFASIISNAHVDGRPDAAVQATARLLSFLLTGEVKVAGLTFDENATVNLNLM